MSALSNQCETTAHLGRACRGCPDCMGIPAPKSRIVILAIHQKACLRLAARSLRMIKRGLFSARRASSEQRWAKRQIDQAVSDEREMIELAFKRPDDAENFGNYDLVGAISNLTQSRVNRLAYFGRVLP